MDSQTINIKLLVLVFIWSLPWKAWAMWKAANNKSKVWFVILLAVQTVGLLDIIYIFFLDKEKSEA